MHTIGLTGGIGSGKSTVASRFAELGAIVIDADELAREVVAVGTPGFHRVVERFGTDMLAPDGSLDRPALGSLVFADPDALADLNAIVHPLVGERTAALMATAGPEDVVVYDVPLLAENNMQGGFDAVVVVEAPLTTRLERLVLRGLSEADAQARIAAQATDEDRRAVATYVLDNSGSVAEVNAQIDAVWAQIMGNVDAEG